MEKRNAARKALFLFGAFGKTVMTGGGLLSLAAVMFCGVVAAAPLTGSRTVLDGGWQLQTANSPDTLPDEGAWEAVGEGLWPSQKYRKGSPHNVWYKRVISVPAAWEDGRVLLDFHRIDGDAIIFCNGERVGELLRPGGEFELTEAVTFGTDNDLTVFVTRNYTGVSRGFEDDPLRYIIRGPEARRPLPVEKWPLGITAPVELVWRPAPAAIAGVLVRTSWREKELAVDADIESTKPVSGVRLEIRVADEGGKEVLVATGGKFDLPSGLSVQTVRSEWKDPIPWELGAPYLYTVSVRLLDGKGTLDELPGQRFGFREIWTEGRHVYLNGHVSRWRMETFGGISKNSLSLLRLLGRNVFLRQNNPTGFWSSWSDIPYYGTRPDLFDKEGFGLLMPALNVSLVRDAILRHDRARADYEREMRLWVRRYRNHPSILAWCVTMNDMGDRAAIHPATIGQRTDYGVYLQAQVVEKAMETVRANDPTRLVFSHSGGNFTDIAASNTYPNWAPFQEVADWAERWAERGDMPWMPAEWGICGDYDWFKGGRFFGTEFAAIYFGDEAYAEESRELLAKTVELSVAGRPTLSDGRGKEVWKHFPMYWKIHDLFATYCDRAFRTWGVLAWQHWNFPTGYGDPPEFKGPRPYSRYVAMTEPVTEKPEWANPFFDIYGRHMQPLLAYIGGSPTHTDRTHAYFVGETVEKQAVLVWDGPGDRSFDLQWQLIGGDSEQTRGSTNDISMEAGDVLLLPITFAAPDVNDRSEFIIEMQLSENGETLAEDSFAIRVFPKTSPPRLTAKAAIWDPEGKTKKWTGNFFASPPTDVVPGDTLEGYDLLLVGREALGPGAELPWSPEDIRRGLKVIVFAQKPRLWEGFGFIPDDLMSRRVFPNVKTHPMLDGLETEDLRDWRGSPDLLPAFEREYGHDGPRSPRSSNRNTVASVVLRIPETIGFTPILNAEFDLDYSPLLQFRDGSGAVWFCSLDLDERVDVDPVATRLAANLLKAAVNYTPQNTKVTVVRPNEPLDNPEVLEFVRNGGRAVILPRPATDIEALGFSLESARLHRAALPGDALFAGIGPRLLRWRDVLELDVFSPAGQPEGSRVYSDGLFLTQKIGLGERLFIRPGAELLETRYAEDKEKHAAVQTSVWRLRQLTAQLLTNAGVSPAPEVAARLAKLTPPPAFEDLATWYATGPFYVDRSKPAAEVLDQSFSAETNAIEGNTSPDVIYPTPDGRSLNFRTIARGQPHPQGGLYVDLESALRPDRLRSVGYATRIVRSDSAREAILRLGVDFWMQVWVNGKTVYRLADHRAAPTPNRHVVKVNLKPGDNVITIKVVGGNNGFGFWANISTGTVDVADIGGEDADAVSLYPPDIHAFDPYVYHYW